MVKVIPAENYQEKLRIQKARILKTDKVLSKMGQWDVNCAWFGVFLTLATIGMMQIGVIEEPDLTGELILLGMAVCIGLLFYAGHITQTVSQQELRCPHCEQGIDVSTQFRCGWCDELVEKLTKRFAFEPCNQCGRAPNAIECPACGNDVVLDTKSYGDAPEVGFGKAGTMTQLRPFEVKVKG